MSSGKKASGKRTREEYEDNHEDNGVEELKEENLKAQKAEIPEGFPDGNDPNNPVRIYADGVYDMFHTGHAKQLEQAKKMFKHVCLIVGVSGDEETHKLKGKTVMNEDERKEAVWHCKWVDEVIMPCPWIISVEFLDKHNIHYVAHDALPYTSGADADGDIYSGIKKLGRFKETKRTEGVSTTDLIMRIVRDYDTYVRRNLQRGVNRKEMNVSLMKETRLKMSDWKDNIVSSIFGKIRSKPVGKGFDESINKLQSNLEDTFDNWKSKSNRFVKKFVQKFDKTSSKIKASMRDHIVASSEEDGMDYSSPDEAALERDNSKTAHTNGN